MRRYQWAKEIWIFKCRRCGLEFHARFGDNFDRSLKSARDSGWEFRDTPAPAITCGDCLHAEAAEIFRPGNMRRDAFGTWHPVIEVRKAIDRVAVKQHSCKFCKAKRGEMCKTKNGPTAKIHAVRWKIAERRMRPKTHPSLRMMRI